MVPSAPSCTVPDEMQFPVNAPFQREVALGQLAACRILFGASTDHIVNTNGEFEAGKERWHGAAV